MFKYLFLIMLTLTLFSCSRNFLRIMENSYEPNLIPFYGYPHQLKTEEMKKADTAFIAYMVDKYQSRQKAAKACACWAWEYFNKDDFNTAMKRFNEVWLLDTSSFESYWGFGLIASAKCEPVDDILKYLVAAHDRSPENFIKQCNIDCAIAYHKSFQYKTVTDSLKKSILKTEILSCFNKYDVDSVNFGFYTSYADAYYNLNETNLALMQIDRAVKKGLNKIDGDSLKAQILDRRVDFPCKN
jgi:hypothetical protein